MESEMISVCSCN